MTDHDLESLIMSCAPFAWCNRTLVGMVEHRPGGSSYCIYENGKNFAAGTGLSEMVLALRQIESRHR